MSIRNAVTDTMMKVMSQAHRGLLALSGGRIGSRLGTMPVVELHTIGRKTGEKRAVMLSAPVHEDGKYVLVASKGGDDRNPVWYLNLVANPEVELTVHGQTIPMRARTATAEEKAELWPQIVAAYRGYAQYQTKTSRDIPVVICQPRAGTSA
jgi:deazaflavin-dependent oxidoreductase (nitroreductase family)